MTTYTKQTGRRQGTWSGCEAPAVRLHWQRGRAAPCMCTPVQVHPWGRRPKQLPLRRRRRGRATSVERKCAFVEQVVDELIPVRVTVDKEALRALVPIRLEGGGAAAAAGGTAGGAPVRSARDGVPVVSSSFSHAARQAQAGARHMARRLRSSMGAVGAPSAPTGGARVAFGPMRRGAKPE